MSTDSTTYAVASAAVVRGLDGIEDDWADLADRVAAPPSGHPGYARCWLEAYSHPDRLLAGTVRRDGRLVALLPLVGDGSTLAGMAEAEELLVVADRPSDARAAAATVLGLPIARARLRPVSLAEATHTALRAAATDVGASVHERTIEQHPVLDITGSWEDYLAALPGKSRGELRRSRRRLDELGDVTTDVRGGDEALAGLDEALALEAAGWKGRTGTALAVHETDGRFFRGIAGWAAGRGWLWLTFLRLNGRAIAFALELEAHGVRYGVKTAYDETLRRVSPGRLVIAGRIEDAFRSGCIRYDFAGPERPHTAFWTDRRRPIAEVNVFPGSSRGRRAALGHATHMRLRTAARVARDAVRSRH